MAPSGFILKGLSEEIKKNCTSSVEFFSFLHFKLNQIGCYLQNLWANWGYTAMNPEYRPPYVSDCRNSGHSRQLIRHYGLLEWGDSSEPFLSGMIDSSRDAATVTTEFATSQIPGGTCNGTTRPVTTGTCALNSGSKGQLACNPTTEEQVHELEDELILGVSRVAEDGRQQCLMANLMPPASRVEQMWSLDSLVVWPLTPWLI